MIWLLDKIAEKLIQLGMWIEDRAGPAIKRLGFTVFRLSSKWAKRSKRTCSECGALTDSHGNSVDTFACRFCRDN